MIDHQRDGAIGIAIQRGGNHGPVLLIDILPMLRKQNGFKDEITFLAEDGRDAVAISLWDRKENAEQYSRDTYPKVLKGLTNLVEGTPEVQAYEVGNSTFHKIASNV